MHLVLISFAIIIHLRLAKQFRLLPVVKLAFDLTFPYITRVLLRYILAMLQGRWLTGMEEARDGSKYILAA
jgi:hypothetical protein